MQLSVFYKDKPNGSPLPTPKQKGSLSLSDDASSWIEPEPVTETQSLERSSTAQGGTGTLGGLADTSKDVKSPNRWLEIRMRLMLRVKDPKLCCHGIGVGKVMKAGLATGARTAPLETRSHAIRTGWQPRHVYGSAACK